jgi:hypothetical protein
VREAFPCVPTRDSDNCLCHLITASAPVDVDFGEVKTMIIDNLSIAGILAGLIYSVFLLSLMLVDKGKRFSCESHEE